MFPKGYRSRLHELVIFGGLANLSWYIKRAFTGPLPERQKGRLHYFARLVSGLMDNRAENLFKTSG